MLSRSLAVIAVTLIPLGARAQDVVDQASYSGGLDYANFGGFVGLFGSAAAGQSFITNSGAITGAGFVLRNSSGDNLSGTVQVQLWSGATRPTTALASSTVTVALGASALQWVDAFWSPFSATAGTRYWVTIRNTESSNSNPFGGGAVVQYVSDPVSGPVNAYGSGAAAYYNGSNWSDFGSYDVAFRTYTASTVPEPGTWALVGTGLLAVGGVAARRRRTTA